MKVKTIDYVYWSKTDGKWYEIFLTSENHFVTSRLKKTLFLNISVPLSTGSDVIQCNVGDMICYSIYQINNG